MIRKYTSTPFIPRGTSRPLYLNVSELPQSASPTQFPLDGLHLWKLLPYSKTEAPLSCEEGEMWYRTYPLSWEILTKHSKEAHCLSTPVALLIPSSTLPFLLEEGVQTEIILGYNPALQCLQTHNQAHSQLESEQSKEALKLECKYNA